MKSYDLSMQKRITTILLNLKLHNFSKNMKISDSYRFNNKENGAHVTQSTMVSIEKFVKNILDI